MSVLVYGRVFIYIKKGIYRIGYRIEFVVFKSNKVSIRNKVGSSNRIYFVWKFVMYLVGYWVVIILLIYLFVFLFRYYIWCFIVLFIYVVSFSF